MASSTSVPTEDAPEVGAIKLFGIKLSDGERWEQDGDYVFRSTEFDVIAAAPSFEEGLRRFGSELLRFAAYLVELDDPADNEIEMLRALQPYLTCYWVGPVNRVSPAKARRRRTGM